MATTKPERTEAADGRVEIYVPKGYINDEPNLFISVNGKNFLLPKGKTAKVPPEVAYEFERAKRAQMKRDENIDALSAANN